MLALYCIYNMVGYPNDLTAVISARRLDDNWIISHGLKLVVDKAEIVIFTQKSSQKYSK